MARAATTSILVLIQLWVAAVAVAAPDRARMDDPFEITADEITYDEARDLYVADRNVRIVQGNRSLRARWVAFSTSTRMGVAEGDVEVIDAGDQLNAEFMVFDVDSLLGMLFESDLDAGSEGFRVKALELVRTGKNTFTVREGVFTTCRCPDDGRLPWTLRAKDARVELGGYAVLKNSTVQVLGVPVLWLPWAVFPVKSERETGFLLPDFTFGGRGGASFGLPFFWAVHPQLNVTITPRYFTERGYKQDVELEYVFGERSEGDLFVAGLHDESVDTKGSARRDRWTVIWDHDQWLPGKLRWQSDLNLASDNLYAADFAELRDFKSFRFMESTTNVARDLGAGGGVGAMVAARFADDIQGSSKRDRDEFILQRWVEARGDVQPGTLTGPLGLDARIDSELIYFSGLESTPGSLKGVDDTAARSEPIRNDGRFYDFGFDGLYTAGGAGQGGEGNGVFDPGEPLGERGARLVLHPRIARPFILGRSVEFVPEIGWQQTLYRTNNQDFAERGLLTARSELRTRLSRDYLHEDGSSMRHIVEPRLSWAFVSRRHQKHNPLFVPESDVEQTRYRTLSLENISRDPADRIDSANRIVLSLQQRFFRKKSARKGARLQADLITAIDWDLADHNGLGNIVAEMRLFPIGPVKATIRGAFDPEAVAVEEGGLSLGFDFPFDDLWVDRFELTGSYRYVRRPPRFFEYQQGSSNPQERRGDTQINQLDFETRIELAWRIRLSYRGVFSFTRLNDQGGNLKNAFLRNEGTVEYVSKCRCWGFGVTLRHDRNNGFQGGFMIRLLGLGDERSNLFDGGLGAGANL